jgi:choloylglycine hydrolase
MVLVNKRGMVKVATTPKPAKWTSRYGSVTFNQFGRDVPTGGMNEAGLVVELMWLDGTRYPKADARPEVGTLEWIQYQLDTAGSVAGVLANMKHVRIAERGVPLHYLVADKTGDVAAIEFLGGEVVVHRGESLRVPVLANDPYATANRGGSAARFTKAASMLGSATSVDGAFAILDAVAQGHWTRWSIVYDLRNAVVHYRTLENRERRRVKLRAFDFACATPVQMLDVDAGAGDVTAHFTDYTYAANLALARRSLLGTSFTKATPPSEIEAAARHPESATCAR